MKTLNRISKQFAGSRVGRKLGPKVLHHADQLLYALTGSRLTLTQLLSGTTPVWLTSTGARSGEPRTVPLIGFQDGERIILVASNWGQKHHPAWYYNLTANPTAEVRIGNHSRKYSSRLAEGEEYERYWRQAVAFHPGYANYKVSAGSRHIPLFVLEPIQKIPDGPLKPDR